MTSVDILSYAAFFGAGGITVDGIASWTGFFDLIEAHKEKGVLHDGTSYQANLTGIGPIDNFLNTVVQFTWPCVDGSAPGLSLQCLLFPSFISSFYMIWLLEGYRNGNRGRLISYLSVYGILCQVLGLAVAGPLYLLLYVSTSPTISAPSVANLSIELTILSGIPTAFVLGFVPLTLLLCLLAPSFMSLETKIKAIPLWQAVPVYVVAVLQLWKLAFSGRRQTENVSPHEQRGGLRRVYKFGLALTVPSHAIVWGISLAALVLPDIFTPPIAAAFHPLAALIPANPFTQSETSTASMAQGTLCFLQWDYWMSALTYLFFSLRARFCAKIDSQGFRPKDMAELIVRTITLGPMGASLSYMWERDEIVFEMRAKDISKSDLN